MPKSIRMKRLRDSYRFPRFHPALTVRGLFGDPRARVIRLTRRSKKPGAEFVAGYGPVGMTANCAVSEICRLGMRASSLSSTTVRAGEGAAAERRQKGDAEWET